MRGQIYGRAVTRSEFEADPDSIMREATEKGCVTITTDSGKTVIGVISVPGPYQCDCPDAEAAPKLHQELAKLKHIEEVQHKTISTWTARGLRMESKLKKIRKALQALESENFDPSTVEAAFTHQQQVLFRALVEAIRAEPAQSSKQ